MPAVYKQKRTLFFFVFRRRTDTNLYGDFDYLIWNAWRVARCLARYIKHYYFSREWILSRGSRVKDVDC